jgi:hypothetical protein
MRPDGQANKSGTGRVERIQGIDQETKENDAPLITRPGLRVDKLIDAEFSLPAYLSRRRFFLELPIAGIR